MDVIINNSFHSRRYFSELQQHHGSLATVCLVWSASS
jgi:hypothetical protein